jgi:hypothetical protein
MTSMYKRRLVLIFLMALVENYLKVLLASMKTVVCKKLYLGEPPSEAVFKEKHGVWIPYAGVDYNLTLCRLLSRLQDINYGQPYARVDFIPQPGTKNLASDRRPQAPS